MIQDPKQIHFQALDRVSYDALRLVTEMEQKRPGIYAVNPTFLIKLKRSLLELAKIEEALQLTQGPGARRQSGL